LYGVVQRQSGPQRNCQRATFLNSYFVDPHYLLPNDDDEAQYTSCSSSSNNNNNNNNNRNNNNNNNNNNGQQPYGLGCTESGEFAYFEYSLNWQNEAVCDGQHVLHVVDAMDDYNAALLSSSSSTTDHDCWEISSDTATTLLTYAVSCSYEDPDCPDPVGMLQEYRTAARNPYRENVKWTTGVAWSLMTIPGLYVVIVLLQECGRAVCGSAKKKWWQRKAFWRRFYDTDDGEDRTTKTLSADQNGHDDGADSAASMMAFRGSSPSHSIWCIPPIPCAGLFGQQQRQRTKETTAEIKSSSSSPATNNFSFDQAVNLMSSTTAPSPPKGSRRARKASPAKRRPEGSKYSPFFGIFSMGSRDTAVDTVSTAKSFSLGSPGKARARPKVLELPRIDKDAQIPALSPTSTFSSLSLFSLPSCDDDDGPRLILANMPVHDLPVKRKKRRWSFFPRSSKRDDVHVLPETSQDVMPENVTSNQSTPIVGFVSDPARSIKETSIILEEAEKVANQRSTSIRSSFRYLLPSDDQNSLLQDSILNTAEYVPPDVVSTSKATHEVAVPIYRYRSERPFDEITAIDESSVAAQSSLLCCKDDFRPTCTDEARNRPQWTNQGSLYNQETTLMQARATQVESRGPLNNEAQKEAETEHDNMMVENQSFREKQRSGENDDVRPESNGLLNTGAQKETAAEKDSNVVVAQDLPGKESSIAIIGLASAAISSASTDAESLEKTIESRPIAPISRSLRDPEGYKYPFQLEPVKTTTKDLPSKHVSASLAAPTLVRDVRRMSRSESATMITPTVNTLATVAPPAVVQTIGRLSRSKSATRIASRNRRNTVSPPAVIRDMGRMFRSKSPAKIHSTGSRLDILFKARSARTNNDRQQEVRSPSASSSRAGIVAPDQRTTSRERPTRRSAVTAKRGATRTTKHISKERSTDQTTIPLAPEQEDSRPHRSQKNATAVKQHSSSPKPVGIKEYLMTREQRTLD
jgi:hypothetical protein